ncbi:MAG: SDR family NAD(P)-dependent oxidoreductase [bacterium]
MAFAARNPADVQDKAKWLGAWPCRWTWRIPPVAAAVAQVEATLGPIDVLVNNAGVALSSPFARTTAEDWPRRWP